MKKQIVVQRTAPRQRQARTVRVAAAPKTAKHFTSWSFSRWRDYKTCPAMAQFKYLQKYKEEENDAIKYGNFIHETCEDFLNRKITKLPRELKDWRGELAQLLKHKARPEVEFAFTDTYAQCGWTDAKAWLRVKLDAQYIDQKRNVVVVVDFKTGREKPEEHDMQLELYGLAALETYPDVAQVTGELWYIDHGTKRVLDFYPDERNDLRTLWAQRTAPMLRATQFKPTPGDACRWCPFSKKRGGPCAY